MLASALLASGLTADDVSPPLPQAARMARLEKQLPTDRREAESFLWSEFAKDEKEMDVPDLKVAAWQSLRDAYVSALVSDAKASGMEADALLRILKRIDSERQTLALVPVEAYRTTQGTRNVWIVICRWEMESLRANANVRMGHVRMFAYDIESLERLAFRTCM